MNAKQIRARSMLESLYLCPAKCCAVSAERSQAAQRSRVDGWAKHRGRTLARFYGNLDCVVPMSEDIST